jgi:hypothetical protein
VSEGPAAPDDADDPELTGRAVVELRGLTLPVDARFADRVGRRIERRALTNEFMEFAWALPVAVLLELLLIPGQMLRAKKRATTESGT